MKATSGDAEQCFFFQQLNAIDAELLEDEQANPQNSRRFVVGYDG